MLFQTETRLPDVIRFSQAQMPVMQSPLHSNKIWLPETRLQFGSPWAMIHIVASHCYYAPQDAAHALGYTEEGYESISAPDGSKWLGIPANKVSLCVWVNPDDLSVLSVTRVPEGLSNNCTAWCRPGRNNTGGGTDIGVVAQYQSRFMGTGKRRLITNARWSEVVQGNCPTYDFCLGHWQGRVTAQTPAA